MGGCPGGMAPFLFSESTLRACDTDIKRVKRRFSLVA